MSKEGPDARRVETHPFECTAWLQQTHQMTTKGPKNRRGHQRAVMSLTACVRQPGRGEEIVTAAYVSKSGMRFLSKMDYSIFAWVEVAIPYTPGGTNIFTSGHVVRARVSNTSGYKEYAIRYASSPV
jgi:hypothetical protein